MTSFVQYRLPELLKFIVDNRGRTCPTSDDGIPLIATNCVKDGYFYPVFENVRHVDPVTYKNWFRSHPEPGDILFVCKGSPGRIAMVPDPVTFCIAQDMLALRADETIIDNRYLYYLLKSKDTQDKIANLHVGTMIPHFKKGDFGKLVLSVHTNLSEQRAIAEVLGALDDKIAANTKLTETTHGLLQAAYRGVSIPAGGSPVRVETLVQRLTPNRKFVPGELKSSGDFPVFDQSESGFLGYLDGDDYLDASPDDPVLYFGDHTCQLRISSEKFTVGPNTVPFKGMGIPTLTLYCAISGLQRHEEYKRHWQLLMKKEICLPNEAAANKFARMHTPLLTVIKEAREENETLAATRDTLLPQLMSGKLRVRDIENIMGEMV